MIFQMVKIPKCMSTQHPDNARIPGFAEKDVLKGEDEVYEALFAFSRLKCDEQMWDAEGKDVYSSVIRSLLEKDQDYFNQNKLGKDLRLTLRVPNPKYEKVEQKVLLEVLENIPRSFDTARKFYTNEKPPIFEVILPMTTSSNDLNRIYHYYKRYIGHKDERRVHDIRVRDWLGESKPKEINVIPLIEEKEYMLSSDTIIKEYLDGKDLKHQRVFLARSDPALNYGLISAVLINKIALEKLDELEERLNVKIHPIIGVGAAPFRGNFNPYSYENSLKEYPSVDTFTIQSAFKYDYPEKEVKEAIEKIKSKRKGKALKSDTNKQMEIIEKTSRGYRVQIEKLADEINRISQFVPSRRSRKLHIGLFGYSRELSNSENKTYLPRAIKFTASLYSLGIPPEIIGLHCLSKEDFQFLNGAYLKWAEDIKSALPYFNEQALRKFPYLWKDFEKALKYFNVKQDHQHKEGTSIILNSSNPQEIKRHIYKLAKIRRFLG